MISVHYRGGTALLLLDRAEKLNAMDATFWPSLVQAIAWSRERHARAIVITGAGNRAFSAGGDIDSFTDLNTNDARHSFQKEAMSAFGAIADCDVPTIAAVNGLALGGGCEIAMACDFVLAGKRAKFGLPETRLGLVPGYGVLAAPQRVGVQMASFMILTGEALSAEEAARCGLVQKVCDDEALLDEALRLADTIAATSCHAIAGAKALMKESLNANAIAASIDLVSRLHATQDAQEAVARFLADRPQDGGEE